ncbi:MAG: VanZ family protein [Ruminococcus sp.]|uniref:VanZ family protein n=1 Tax=Ruminococcus sp. TaxID=41978 RepID=UPI0025D44734|nr:VanZ family protein [Ruminococcus sp.]MBR5683147.1 VanZ family protein [Ruminococcus sp.]
MKMLKKLSRTQIVFLLLTIALMVTIFCLSAQNADSSSNTSSRFTKLFIKIFYADYSSFSPEKQHEIWEKASFTVRKLAHFSIYTALGFCASFTVGKRRLFSLKSLFVVLFGFIYAFSDEFHQSFSEGRSCEFRDMMIDTCGALTGMLISLVVMAIIALFLRKRRNSR